MRLYPRGTAIRPHSAVRPDPTDCPGPAARAAIARGDFTPNSSPEDDMTPAQMQELKNFIEARTQAYALWVKKAMVPEVERIVKAYTNDMKNFERQTDAADAARAAAAVWATQPRPGQAPGQASGDPVDPTDPVDPADPSDPEQPIPFPPLLEEPAEPAGKPSPPGPPNLLSPRRHRTPPSRGHRPDASPGSGSETAPYLI